MSEENEKEKNESLENKKEEEKEEEKSLKEKMKFLGDAVYESWRKDCDRVFELKKIDELLKDIINKCNKIEEIENYFNNNNEDLDYFINDFSKKVIEYILRQNIIFGENGDEMAFQVLLDYIIFLIKYILNNDNNNKFYPMIEIIKEIFDDSKVYYKSSINSREKNPTSKKNISLEKFNEMFLKRKLNLNINEIKEGEEIDVLVPIKENYYETKVWSRGKIISKIEKDFYVEVLNQKDLIKFNINSFDYSLKGSKTKDWEWRINLKENDIIDCYSRRKYYPATIIKRNEEENQLEYHVSFRIYLDLVNNDIEKYKIFFPGKEIEEEYGRQFIGEDSNYDEDILATSKRINMKDTKLNIGDDLNLIDDNDIYYIDDQVEDVYLNGKKNITIGRYFNYEYYYNLLLIEFGNLNGFDIMINFLNNNNNKKEDNDNRKMKKNDDSEIINFIFYIFKNVIQYLYKPFAIELSKKLSKSIFDYVDNLSNNDLRNMKKETHDLMIDVLKLYLNINNDLNKDNKYLIETFALNFAIKMLKTNFLDKRTTAIKSISDFIKLYKNNEEFKKVLIDLIKKNNIIYEIYGPNSHVQLVSKSKELIEFLLTNDKLSEEELSLIWNATKTGDLDEKKIVLKILNEIISCNLNSNDENIKLVIVKILNSIQKDNYNFNSDMSEEEIHLIFSLINELNDTQIIGNYLNRFIDFIKENSQSKYVNFISRRICDISNKDSQLKKNIINHALEFIVDSKNSFLGYRLLTIYLNKSNLTIDSDLSNLLLENNNLLNLFKKSFHDYYLNKDKIEPNNHEKNIRNKITFLDVLIKNDIWKVEEDSPIDFVYNFLVLNKYNENDEKIFYNWINSLIREKKFEGIEEKIFKLFTDNKNNLNNNISIEGFKTFLRVFIEINENENKLEKDNENNIILKDNVSSKDLKGFSELKRIIFENTNNEIITRGIDLLNTLFMKNRENLIDLCLEEINNSNSNSKIINKCISILSDLMYLNEENGTAETSSHISIIRSDLINLNCLINLPYNINSQFKKISVYSNSTFYSFKTQISHILNYHHDFMKFELINPRIKNQNDDNISYINNGNNNRIELTRHDNGKSLKSLNIRNNSQIYISTNHLELKIEDKNLLDSNNRVIPEAEKIFNDWFDYYSTNDKMTANDIAQFIKDVTNSREEIKINDSRVLSLINEKEELNEGYIEREKFVNWYINATLSKPQLVLENIKATGYRGDLKKINEGFYYENNNKESMIRFILGNNNQLINVLFNIMNKGNIDVYYFVVELCTNDDIYNKILQIKNLNDNINWDELLMNNNLYYFCYVCIIIEYFIENGNFSIEFQEWIKVFISFNGYKFIIDVFINILKRICKKDNYEKHIDNVCFELLIKIIKLIYLCSIKSNSNNEDLYKYLNEENLINKINENFTNKEMFSLLMNIIDSSIKQKWETNIINEIIQLIILLIPNIEDSSYNNELINFLLNGLISEKEETRISFVNALKRMNNILITKEKYDIISKLFEEIGNNINNNDKVNESLSDCFIYLLSIYNEKKDKFILNENFDINLFAEKLRNEINDELTINFKKPKLSDKKLLCDLTILSKLIEINDSIKKETNENSKLFENILKKIIFYSEDEEEEKKEENLVSTLTDKITEIEKNEKMEFINIDTIKKIKETNRSSNIEILNLSYNLISNLLKENLENFKLYFSIEKEKKNNSNNEIDTSKKYKYERRKLNYVGLKNLGCICYMNSTMQQFYMTPTLRYTVLKLNDNKKINLVNIERFRKYEKLDDNMFHQLQKLFSYLLLSERADYNPFGFTYSFKDFDGNPTKLFEQKDTQEFLAIFLDRLEQSSKNSEYKYMINNIFGGKNCSLITCLDCGYVSYKFEPSVFLSLEVKNMKNLNDSLDKYINEEYIDGYECDGCKKKCKISKRNIIASLPNVLIIHLQRIFYNWEIDHNEKINSKLEFPKQINLKNYTIENMLKEKENKKEEIYFRSDEYYNYYLVGVVVHVGSADSGHYYSYINTIRDGEGNISYFNPNDNNVNFSWLEFNDSSISKFDISKLEEETFGGNYNNDNNSNNTHNFNGRNNVFNWRREKCKNAYLLVYERLVKNPNIITILNPNEINEKLKGNIIEFNENEESKIFKEYDMMRYYNKNNLNEYNNKCNELYSKIFHNLKKDEYFKFEPFYNYNNNRLVPKIYYDEILNDNKNFEKSKKISESQYSSFFTKMIDLLEEISIKNIDKITSEDAEEISNVFVSYILSNIQNKINKENLSNGCKKLINVIESNKELFKNPITKLLVENTEKFRDLLRYESSDVSKEINDLNDKIKSIIEENNDNIIEINQYNNQNNIYGNNNDIYNGNNDDENENGVERNDDDKVEINQNFQEEKKNDENNTN